MHRWCLCYHWGFGERVVCCGGRRSTERGEGGEGGEGGGRGDGGRGGSATCGMSGAGGLAQKIKKWSGSIIQGPPFTHKLQSVASDEESPASPGPGRGPEGEAQTRPSPGLRAFIRNEAVVVPEVRSAEDERRIDKGSGPRTSWQQRQCQCTGVLRERDSARKRRASDPTNAGAWQTKPPSNPHSTNGRAGGGVQMYGCPSNPQYTGRLTENSRPNETKPVKPVVKCWTPGGSCDSNQSKSPDI